MPELPTGTVTFLFTDLEGSTRLWEEHPDAMQDALARHDEILRDAIASHDGHIVKTTGDGVHAVFATADDALDAAVAAELVLGASPWGATGPLHVRMGLHTCEAELRDGDYYGSAVNRAARLMSAAHGGQIVLSHATEEVALDTVSEGIEVVDLGEHRLRDLTRAERVFQLRGSQLQSDFPPLRSLDAFPGNLPLQLTSFIGRGEELQGIAKSLDEWRLLTIAGVGGVGKTRLAIQIAAETLPRFRDGAWLCELAAVTDADAMAQVVAAELGVSQRPGMSLDASIREFLRAKLLLVVLDNCEHLLDPAGALAVGILRDCPGVRILATSREGLAVSGEHVWSLRSLPLPDVAALDMITNDAVQLFVERAQSVRAEFSLDASNASAISEICRRLDGIPLAIELAAARVVSMTPAEIVARLDERFRLLTGGRRAAVERHQTLRATVEWSYSLLASNDRAVFTRLSVFAGSFDAAAAEAVVSGEGIEPWDVVDALGSLVTKSMVIAEPTADGTTRYQMLETLRQYARERLDELGGTDTWRRRHAEFFAEWAERAGRGLTGADELEWRDRLRLNLDNLRAAVAWALDADDSGSEAALRIVDAFSGYSVADVSVLADWPDRALARISSTTPERRSAVLAAAAQRDCTIGAYDRAIRLSLEGISASGAANRVVPWLAHSTLSFASALSGNYRQAREAAIDGLAIAGNDGFARAFLNSYLAYWAAQFGEQELARDTAEAALEIARTLGNPSALCSVLGAFAYALEREDPERALEAIDEEIELARAIKSSRSFGISLVVAARLRARRGQAREVLDALREAIVHCDETGDRTSLAFAVHCGIQAFETLGYAESAALFAGIADGRKIASVTVSVGSEEEAELQRVRLRLGDELGSDAYEAAWTRGAALSYEELVEFSTAELDRLLSELDDA